MLDQTIKSCLKLVPRGISHWLVGDFTPVFMLHRIIDKNGDPDRQHVANLRQYLRFIQKNKYAPISLDEVVAKFSQGERLPQRSVAFTVDDGYADQFEHLAPIFGEFEIPLTCFVITDFLNGDLWPWDAQVKHAIYHSSKKKFSLNLPAHKEFMCDLSKRGRPGVVADLRMVLKSQDQTDLYRWLPTLYQAAEVDTPSEVPVQYRAGSWSQVREFVASGHAVAAHSKSHRILSRLNDAEARDEILGSYYHLKEKVPNCSKLFAYPTGRTLDFGAREKQTVANSEIMAAMTAVPDAIREGYAMETLPRIGLPDRMADFLQYLSFIGVLKSRLQK